MEIAYHHTRHARERSTARDIPPMIAETIVAYGCSRDAGGGTRKYALTKDSMRELRRVAGRPMTNAIASYQRRNAYVIVGSAGRIITVAYANHPLFR